MDKATVSALAAFPEQLGKLFSAIPEEYIDWTPASWEGIASESFSPVRQLCHIRGIEVEGYHVRLRRLLDEANPTLGSLDSYSLEKERMNSHFLCSHDQQHLAGMHWLLGKIESERALKVRAGS